MEAVRLALPPDALRCVREYCSDRVGVHPTAEGWGMEVDRRTGTTVTGTSIVGWRYKVADGRTMEMNWLKDENGWFPESGLTYGWDH